MILGFCEDDICCYTITDSIDDAFAGTWFDVPDDLAMSWLAAQEMFDRMQKAMIEFRKSHPESDRSKEISAKKEADRAEEIAEEKRLTDAKRELIAARKKALYDLWNTEDAQVERDALQSIRDMPSE